MKLALGAAGAVKGVAQGVGIPDTDQTKCKKAIAEGRYWDASFDCPASDFLRGLFGGGSSTPAALPDATARVVRAAESFDTDPYEWNYN